ncbi:hypothetical protein [Streptomyces virginiae]|uniref:hypothetical protein n=1 Tax=Streptomyces virginiae TaxID=1961 RepID=UPI0022561906|nr:hypothetical protein [Streptomyces virginiae]MCX5278106.1 hypothetical protein [Streptomyces virginiae]
MTVDMWQPLPAHPTGPGRPAVVIRDEMAEVLARVETETRLVRVYGGRLDHTARQERPGRWRMACGTLPVSPHDFERSLCGTACLACDRALRLAADPAAAALRAHAVTVQRRQAAGQAPLPGSEPCLDTSAEITVRAHEEQPAS